jgi:hypothetical protein
MHPLRHLVLAACAAFPALHVEAQSDTTLTGRLVRDTNGFGLACTSVRLQGMAAALDAEVGQLVEIRGRTSSGLPVPVVEVASVRRAVDFFELGGDSRLGRELRFKIVSPRGTTYYFFVGVDEGYVPLDRLFGGAITGTFHLDLGRFLVVANGPFRASWEVGVPVPSDPALVGLRLRAQAAFTAAASPAAYLNPDCTVLQAR